MISFRLCQYSYNALSRLEWYDNTAESISAVVESGFSVLKISWYHSFSEAWRIMVYTNTYVKIRFVSDVWYSSHCSFMFSEQDLSKDLCILKCPIANHCKCFFNIFNMTVLIFRDDSKLKVTFSAVSDVKNFIYVTSELNRIKYSLKYKTPLLLADFHNLIN